MVAVVAVRFVGGAVRCVSLTSSTTGGHLDARGHGGLSSPPGETRRCGQMGRPG